MEGKVKFYNIKKGFGFIVGDDAKEYFVHFTALPQGVFLRENDVVSFDESDNEKGPLAQNVSLLRKGSEVAAEGGEGSSEGGVPEMPENEPEQPADAPEDKTEF